MNVFISWSGGLSKKLAEALRDWIPCVIQACKPYFTPNDIEKGARWANEISAELEKSSIGIVCLTKENLDSSWIMFEAGAISKKLGESSLCPILFGIENSDIKGPLVQFQSAAFSREEIKKLISKINSACGDSKLDSVVLDSVFDNWWSKLDDKVKTILDKYDSSSEKPIRSDREILEEVLENVRMKFRPIRNISRVPTPVIDDLLSCYIRLAREPLTLVDQDVKNILQDFSRPLSFLIKEFLDDERKEVHLKDMASVRALVFDERDNEPD